MKNKAENSGMNARLAAFTVIELLTVSVLAAIAGTMLYSGMGMLNREMNAIKNKADITQRLYTFKHCLQQDTHLCGLITQSDNQLHFYRNTENLPITYTFYDTYCVRTPGHVADTFNFEQITYRFYFDELPADAGGPVDLAQLEIKIWDKYYNFAFNKDYGTEMYVNRLKNPPH